MFAKFDKEESMIYITGIYVDDILITGIDEEIKRIVKFD